MIQEIARGDSIALFEDRQVESCFALAAVACNDLDESIALNGWATLRTLLNGTGTRMGYRTFLALVQNTKTELQHAIAIFSEQQEEDCASWRIFAAHVPVSAKAKNALTEVELRASKVAQYPCKSILNIVDANSECEKAPGHVQTKHQPPA